MLYHIDDSDSGDEGLTPIHVAAAAAAAAPPLQQTPINNEKVRQEECEARDRVTSRVLALVFRRSCRAENPSSLGCDGRRIPVICVFPILQSSAQ